MCKMFRQHFQNQFTKRLVSLWQEVHRYLTDFFQLSSTEVVGYESEIIGERSTGCNEDGQQP